MTDSGSRDCVVALQAAEENNTALQRLAIDGNINLADGHARQPLHPFEVKLLGGSQRIFHDVWRQDYTTVENAFLDRFFAVNRQRRPGQVLLSYSVSSLVHSVGIHLRRQRSIVCYAEPCFDNFIDLVANAGVPTSRVDYSMLGGMLDSAPDFDVLWLVVPGNPNGYELDEAFLAAVAEYCRRNGTVLVVDCCFRLFSPQMTSWCQYTVLAESGASYIILEDTGKVFPFLDLKVGMLAASPDLIGPLHRLNRDLLLNMSPWMLELLGRSCEGAAELGLADYLWRNVARNRAEFVRGVCSSGLLRDLCPTSTVPLLWLEVAEDAPFDAVELRRELHRRDVHVLDGRYFYAERQRGTRRLRIAISRSPRIIHAAAQRIAATIQELTTRHA